jgi:hypothetical protein
VEATMGSGSAGFDTEFQCLPLPSPLFSCGHFFLYPGSDEMRGGGIQSCVLHFSTNTHTFAEFICNVRNFLYSKIAEIESTYWKFKGTLLWLR